MAVVKARNRGWGSLAGHLAVDAMASETEYLPGPKPSADPE